MHWHKAFIPETQRKENKCFKKKLIGNKAETLFFLEGGRRDVAREINLQEDTKEAVWLL